jgi:mRNA-degrading endonuclease RelE of RelBE toxin-antitoxin system
LPYKFIFVRSFTKQFDKLPKGAKEQILKGLEKAASDPYAGFKIAWKTGRSMEMASR